MLSKSKRKRVLAVLVGIVLLLVLYTQIAPAIITRVLSSHLGNVYSQQTKLLLPTITALVGRQPERSVFQCYDSSHSHTTTDTTCQNFQIYRYSFTPLPASSRQQVLYEANKLDSLLKRYGWTADRQQDKIKTVAASVPTTPLAAFYVSEVPFHKNIGNISCNLEISFEGPTQGISPGSINVNEFSCRQYFTYFMLHLDSRQYNTI